MEGLRASLFGILFMIKIAGTFTLQILYTYYYKDRSTADIFRFFDDGIILHDIAYSSPIDFIKIFFNQFKESDGFRSLYFEQMNTWIKPFESGLYNDNIFMIKLNSLIAFISNGCYEVHGVIFSTCAFIGIILLTKSLVFNANQYKISLLIIVLFPSSILFISGGLKETVLVFGAGAFLFAFYSIIRKHSFSWQTILLGIVGLFICANIKPYFLGSILPALLTFIIVRNLQASSFKTISVWVIVMALSVLMVSIMGIDIVENIFQKQTEFINHSLETSPGSLIGIVPIQNTWTSLFSSIPSSLANSLFRPLPWEVNGMPLALMLIENLLLLIILFMSLVNRKRFGVTTSHFTLIALAVIPGLVLIGLISPVLGATMRYRAPFLILVISSLIPYLILHVPKRSSL